MRKTRSRRGFKAVLQELNQTHSENLRGWSLQRSCISDRCLHIVISIKAEGLGASLNQSGSPSPRHNNQCQCVSWGTSWVW